ncbi:MAG: hypothetical protein K0R46_1548 [Herbinix sp.]|nr:hypothetical protein [Herbinix sp.]
MTIIYIIGAIMVGATIYTYIRCLGKPSKNYNSRTAIIEEKVTSIGGSVDKIETSKSSCYPYNDEINQNDGSYHVFYKINYKLDGEAKEGWAVLKMQQSVVGPLGAATNEWIWKFD